MNARSWAMPAEYLNDPPRMDAWIKDRRCPECGSSVEARFEMDEPPRFPWAYFCADGCGWMAFQLPIDMIPAPTYTGASFIDEASDEAKLRVRATKELTQAFEVYSERPLRHVANSRLELRADLVLVPRRRLVEAGFRWEFLVVEIKRKPASRSNQAYAWDQTSVYRDCYLADRTLAGLRDPYVHCAALYQGRMVGDCHDPGPYDGDGLTAVAFGRSNVGEIVHHRWLGLTLLICQQTLWSQREGFPESKRDWPIGRRIANSKIRA